MVGRRDDGSSFEMFRDRIIFPIRDASGRTLGFGGRTPGDGQPKYLNGPQTRFFDKSGCLFALDSDAHAGDQLWMADYAIAHARLAGIPSDRIVNCWPPDKILDWAARSWQR